MDWSETCCVLVLMAYGLSSFVLGWYCSRAVEAQSRARAYRTAEHHLSNAISTLSRSSGLREPDYLRRDAIRPAER
jgi:hypothetical protein